MNPQLAAVEDFTFPEDFRQGFEGVQEKVIHRPAADETKQDWNQERE